MGSSLGDQRAMKAFLLLLMIPGTFSEEDIPDDLRAALSRLAPLTRLLGVFTLGEALFASRPGESMFLSTYLQQPLGVQDSILFNVRSFVEVLAAREYLLPLCAQAVPAVADDFLGLREADLCDDDDDELDFDEMDREDSMNSTGSRDVAVLLRRGAGHPVITDGGSISSLLALRADELESVLRWLLYESGGGAAFPKELRKTLSWD